MCSIAGPPSSLKVKRRMFEHALSNGLADLHRHCVADELAEYVEARSFAVGQKLVRRRERLQDCRLAKGNCSVLLGVAEAAVPKAKALSGDRWRGSVPLHATIHARKGHAGVFAMTIRHQFLVPISPRPSGLRGLDPTHVERRQTTGRMERVARIGLACREGRQGRDRATYRHFLICEILWRQQRNRSQFLEAISTSLFLV